MELGRKNEQVFWCLCSSDSGQLEKQLEDVSLARRDLEDSSRHVKSLEKQMKSLTQERDELHKVASTRVCVMFESLLTKMLRSSSVALESQRFTG